MGTILLIILILLVICKRRSKNPSMKQPSWSVAPE